MISEIHGIICKSIVSFGFFKGTWLEDFVIFVNSYSTDTQPKLCVNRTYHEHSISAMCLLDLDTPAGSRLDEFLPL